MAAFRYLNFPHFGSGQRVCGSQMFPTVYTVMVVVVVVKAHSTHTPPFFLPSYARQKYMYASTALMWLAFMLWNDTLLGAQQAEPFLNSII